MPEPNVIHQATRDTESGRVVFVFVHGEARLVGQALSEEEYRALLIFFEGWRRAKLPPPADVEGWPPEGLS